MHGQPYVSHGVRADARCIPWRFDVGCPMGARCHFGLSAMPDVQREWFKGLSVMTIEVVSRKLV